MFSTPLISCSIGAATVSASTFGLAPGYRAETTMVGGTMSGNCATGSLNTAKPPIMTITIERTDAKIGRSMKKWENFMMRKRVGPDLLLSRGRPLIRGGSDRLSVRLDLGSRASGHQ